MKIRLRMKMLWYVLTKKQVVVITESHKHGTHQWNPQCLWDTRSMHDRTKLLGDAFDDKECETLVGLAVKECKQVMINKSCEIVRDLANEHFGDWEQSCKFEDAFREAMGAVIKEPLSTINSTFEKCLDNVNPETREEVRKNMEKQIMEHTFKFTEGTCPNFECNFEMPAMLYDRLREVVKEFYKEGLYE